MLHLFNKIYLATDSVIDNNIDRVVISDPNGIDVLDYIKNDNGDLLAYGKTEAEVIGHQSVAFPSRSQLPHTCVTKARPSEDYAVKSELNDGSLPWNGCS